MKPLTRSAECSCEHNFTCRYCLDNAKPWLFTPSKASFSPPSKAFILALFGLAGCLQPLEGGQLDQLETDSTPCFELQLIKVANPELNPGETCEEFRGFCCYRQRFENGHDTMSCVAPIEGVPCVCPPPTVQAEISIPCGDLQ